MLITLNVLNIAKQKNTIGIIGIEGQNQPAGVVKYDGEILARVVALTKSLEQSH